VGHNSLRKPTSCTPPDHWKYPPLPFTPHTSYHPSLHSFTMPSMSTLRPSDLHPNGDELMNPTMDTSHAYGVAQGRPQTTRQAYKFKFPLFRFPSTVISEAKQIRSFNRSPPSPLVDDFDDGESEDGEAFDLVAFTPTAAESAEFGSLFLTDASSSTIAIHKDGESADASSEANSAGERDGSDAGWSDGDGVSEDESNEKSGSIASPAAISSNLRQRMSFFARLAIVRGTGQDSDESTNDGSNTENITPSESSSSCSTHLSKSEGEDRDVSFPAPHSSRRTSNACDSMPEVIAFRNHGMSPLGKDGGLTFSPLGAGFGFAKAPTAPRSAAEGLAAQTGSACDGNSIKAVVEEDYDLMNDAQCGLEDWSLVSMDSVPKSSDETNDDVAHDDEVFVSLGDTKATDMFAVPDLSQVNGKPYGTAARHVHPLFEAKFGNDFNWNMSPPRSS
ncbi:hypothetical protein F5X99DRAFT_426004, partial [Biscogniauxia marginata]